MKNSYVVQLVSKMQTDYATIAKFFNAKRPGETGALTPVAVNVTLLDNYLNVVRIFFRVLKFVVNVYFLLW